MMQLNAWTVIKIVSGVHLKLFAMSAKLGFNSTTLLTNVYRFNASNNSTLIRMIVWLANSVVPSVTTVRYAYTVMMATHYNKDRVSNASLTSILRKGFVLSVILGATNVHQQMSVVFVSRVLLLKMVVVKNAHRELGLLSNKHVRHVLSRNVLCARGMIHVRCVRMGTC